MSQGTITVEKTIVSTIPSSQEDSETTVIIIRSYPMSEQWATNTGIYSVPTLQPKAFSLPAAQAEAPETTQDLHKVGLSTVHSYESDMTKRCNGTETNSDARIMSAMCGTAYRNDKRYADTPTAKPVVIKSRVVLLGALPTTMVTSTKDESMEDSALAG